MAKYQQANLFEDDKPIEVACSHRVRVAIEDSAVEGSFDYLVPDELWPKTFQNLRSTRETELFKMTNGNVKAVCSWIGNSPAVAMSHYAQVTEADLQEAAKMTLINDAEKRVQNPVQTTAELIRTESHERGAEGNVSLCYCGTNDNNTTPCENTLKGQKYARQDSNKNTQGQSSKRLNETTKSKGVQNTVHISHFPPELQQIIDHWDSLPEHIKATIKAIIETATNSQ